ncbi:hydrolase, NUDIX family, putative [Verrucomicrobiia bacterium DG1235]|nr:hydrolase, NUDIX family, putative [Verrucomicrobiae bacterium DG1235]
MQKRSKTKDTWPGAWDSSCSGHVDSGEDYLTAAHRELDEELGYKADRELEMLFKLLPCEETGEEFIHVYRVYGNGPFRLNHDEIEIGEWMNIPNLLERIEFTPQRFSSAFRLIMVRLQALQLLPVSS